jgi:hypothetical protein
LEKQAQREHEKELESIKEQVSNLYLRLL